MDASTNMLGFAHGAYPPLRLICLSAKWNSESQVPGIQWVLNTQ